MDDHGSSSTRSSTIQIGAEMTDSMIVETLIHEALHVFCCLVGLDDEANPTQEERIVQGTTVGILSILLDNPLLLDMVVEVAQGRGYRGP